MSNQTAPTVSKTPSEIVDAIFSYINYMGTGQADADGVPESEMMANVSTGKNGIHFGGFGSDPFIERKRLETYLAEKLKS